MAKPLQHLKARQMRARGESVKIIAQKLNVSKGSVSLWVRDIILSEKQLAKLKQRELKGAELGRLRGSLKQKRQRLEKIKFYNKLGKKRLKKISSNEHFIAGLALYWAEGEKKQRRVSFCNSDPKLVKIMISWLKKHFEINTNQLALRVGINYIHKPREKIVKKFWSDITKIPLNQFRKTSYKKTKTVKIYQNYNHHYGTLTVNLLKPGPIYYKIMGLIEGLSQHGDNYSLSPA